MQTMILNLLKIKRPRRNDKGLVTGKSLNYGSFRKNADEPGGYPKSATRRRRMLDQPGRVLPMIQTRIALKAHGNVRPIRSSV